MKIKLIIYDGYHFIRRYLFLILWISLVLYLFYDKFVYYKCREEFYYLRRILGLGLCISRGTAAVINVCAALILLPICKKLNQILYAVLSRIWPALFFFWLEKAKSIHMTVGITLTIFAVLHSISHFVNLWNFSRGYDEERPDINFANYKNESPFALLLSMAGLTGVSLLLIILSMSLTSMRFIRRKVYNIFWYTHQLYVPFVVLLIVHPLSGVLKKQILDNDSNLHPSQIENWTNSSKVEPKFVPIESRTWLWMILPLTCYSMNLLWRVCTRNRARVEVLEATLMPGRTISLNLSCPYEKFACRAGQYVLLQCLEASLIEWHPFTVVKVPTSYQRNFTVWIRVKGDWTEALEKILANEEQSKLSIFVDGPFSSPMEGASGSEVAICIAAGVGITPFVAMIHDMLLNPRNRSPGRVHLLWIVRNEQELLWLAELASKTIRELRNANRPDRLHLELYVTSNKSGLDNEFTHTLIIDEKGELSHVLNKDGSEKEDLLTPITNINRNSRNEFNNPNIVTQKLGSNLNKIRNSYENEMDSILTPSFKRNNFNINYDEEMSISMPLNRNNSRIKYADDANETDTLLTPNLKRNNSKGKYVNPCKVRLNYANKIVNDLYPFNDSNVKAKSTSSQVPRSICREYNMKKNSEAIIYTNVYTPNSICHKINNGDIIYEDNKHNRNIQLVHNDPISNDNIPRKDLNEIDISNVESCIQIDNAEVKFDIAKEYPLLACRVRRGRPYWDRVFGYWVHLYPSDRLNLYCCGPKNLVKLLKKKCAEYSRDTKTTFAFIHEGFS